MIGTFNKLLLPALACAVLAMPACAAPPQPVAAKRPAAMAELKMKEGVTDIKVGDMTVRVIRGFVGTMSASGYTTYTLYVMPAKAGERWLHITTPAVKGIGHNFRTFETGDSTTQAIAFYKKDEALYAVQATKVGLSAPQLNLARTEVEFRTYKFNQDWDVPMFDDEAVTRSKGKHTEAFEALAKEFFHPKE